MDLARSTLAVTAGRPASSPGTPMNVPVVLSSTFHAGGALAYAREGNPTWVAFEDAVGALEGGHAVAYPSGMAALAAVVETLPHGAVVVAPSTPYTGTAAVLRAHSASGRLVVRLVDTTNPQEVAAACPGADLVWVETESNPLMGVTDLAQVCAAARSAEAVLVVDNTFTTPMAVRPLTLGADLVMHSATKQLAGHSDLLLGVLVAADRSTADSLSTARHLSGSIPGPFEAWLALRGLRTLALRHERSVATAAELARRLTQHSAVVRVRYPGLPGDPGHHLAAREWDSFGFMLSIELADSAAADALCEDVRLWVHATSLGGVESSLERRRAWPGESPLVPAGLVRMSVGVEDAEDLWSDLAAALDRQP